MINDIKFTISFKQVVGFFGSECNAYNVTLTNKDGNTCRYTYHDSRYNTQRNTFITDNLINNIITNICLDYDVNDNNYPTFESFCSEFGYDNHKESKKIYKDCIKLSNKIHRVVSDSWIDAIRLMQVMECN